MGSDEQRKRARAEWEQLERRLELLTPEFCSRLFRRTLTLAHVIRYNAKIFARQITLMLGAARVGDQIGTLLAGAYSLVSNDRITDEQAKQVIAEHDWDEFVQPEEERDDMACLRHLLQHKIRVENVTGLVRERSVAEALAIACGRGDESEGGLEPPDAMKALKRNGMSVKGDNFAIAHNHSALATIYKNTAWIRYREQLYRLPFMTNRNAVVFISGNTRAVLLRLDDVLDRVMNPA